MTRPKLLRLIESVPEVRWFKPAGIQMCSLEEISLTFDEIEAIRLADLEGLYQEQVAKRMDVSRQTVGRILTSAHKKIAEALVQGKAIRLEGGEFQFKLGANSRNKSDADRSTRPVDASNTVTTIDYNKRGRFIAVTAEAPNLDADVDIRFGRARYFLIVDIDNDTFQVLTNEDNVDTKSGVGIRNLQRLTDAGVDVVISGKVGQKVMKALLASKIKTYLVDTGTVREAVTQYKSDHPN